MEVNITKHYESLNDNAHYFSASCMELGQNAGTITWQNSIEEAENQKPPLLNTEEEKQAFRDHIEGFGAWDSEEIESWSDTELNALFIQLVSGDIRESCLDSNPDNWEEYEKEAEQGLVAGNLFRGIDNEIYYSLYS